jgi:hypothetical protein
MPCMRRSETTTSGRLYAQPNLFGTSQEHLFSRARRDPNVVGASGMSNAQARDIVQRFESGPKRDDFLALRDRISNIRDFITSEMIRGSPDTISQWYRDSRITCRCAIGRMPTTHIRSANRRAAMAAATYAGPRCRRHTAARPGRKIRSSA